VKDPESVREPKGETETVLPAPALKNGLPGTPAFGLLPAPQPEPELTTQSINFPPIPSREFGPTVPLKATASSGLPVIFKSATSSTCEVLGQREDSFAQALRNSIAPDPVLCTVVATQSGDAKFAPATPVERSFTLVKPRESASSPAMIATRIVTTNAGRMTLKGVKGAQFSAMLKTNTSVASGKISASVATPSTCSIVKITSVSAAVVSVLVKPLAKGTCSLQLFYAGDSKSNMLSSSNSWSAVIS